MQLMRKACFADKDSVCQSGIFVVLVATSSNVIFYDYLNNHIYNNAFCRQQTAAGDKSQIIFVNLTGGGCSLFSGHVCTARQNKILLK